jgi:hypothetical protein
MFVYLVTNRAPQDKILSHFMKIINGYNLKVDLDPLAKIINTNDFHRPQSPLPWKGICSGSKLCLCICNS